MTAKKDETAGLIHPANLWGKPLPKSLSRPIKDVQEEKMIHDEEDDEPITDVRAELDRMDEPTDDDLINESEEDDVDGVDFEPEAGDVVVAEAEDELEEDEESESEEVGAAVATEEEEVVAETPRKKRETAMAETKKMSISDHVREEIARRQKSGDSLRGVDIVNALAARKITVSAAQVSQLLKKSGVTPKARGTRKAKAPVAAGEGRSRATEKATPRTTEKAPREKIKIRRKSAEAKPAVGVARGAANGLKLPMAQLEAAQAFVEACGGLSQAGRILTLAGQISEAAE